MVSIHLYVVCLYLLVSSVPLAGRHSLDYFRFLHFRFVNRCCRCACETNNSVFYFIFSFFMFKFQISQLVFSLRYAMTGVCQYQGSIQSYTNTLSHYLNKCEVWLHVGHTVQGLLCEDCMQIFHYQVCEFHRTCQEHAQV